MKRRRYIAWILIWVSMVMLTAAVLPHHHHQHILCLHNDVAACECDCGEGEENHATESHHACEDHCVTNFQGVTPDEGVLARAEQQGINLLSAKKSTFAVCADLASVL